MNRRRLLIAGAGTYALVAYEIAVETGAFETIDFVDDQKTLAPTGERIAGTTKEIRKLEKDYSDIIVALGNPEVRLSMLERIEKETGLTICTLVSPRAYVAPSARMECGVIVEPMAVIHASCQIGRGALISAGAVINHESICKDGVHVDCNATVPGYQTVPAKTKVRCGTVYGMLPD